ncbi:hypothetical protein [Methylotuvimicrobium buryatense]|nr:hypothetical protein [Methylotuvimicrobium buryatense]
MSNSDDLLIQVENVSKKFCRSLKRSMLYGIEDISRDRQSRYTPASLCST